MNVFDLMRLVGLAGGGILIAVAIIGAILRARTTEREDYF